MASIEVKVPDIGDFDEVSVIEVLVKVGDTVKVEQSLVTVESDKASMEIPSSQAGVVEEMLVKVGDKVSEGSAIARVRVAAGAAPATASAAPAPVAAAGSPPPSAPPPAAGGAEKTVPTAALPAHEPTAPTGTLPHASPTIRKLARELGVPLNEVKGSGPKGRITQEDVHGFVKAVLSGAARTQAQASKGAGAAPAAGGGLAGLLPWPQVDFAKFGAIEKKDLSRIK